MQKLIVAARRVPGMTRAQFSRYLQNGHGGKVIRAPQDMLCNMHRYVQNHVVDSVYGAQACGWVARGDHDSVSEIFFNDTDAMNRTISHPYYLATIQPDEREFADHDSLVLMLTQEETQTVAYPRNGQLKMMHFIRTRPDSDRTEFFQLWREACERFAQDEQICRFVRSHAPQLSPQTGGGFGGGGAFNLYAGVTSLWFERKDDHQGVHAYQRLMERFFTPDKGMIDHAHSFYLIVREVPIHPVL